MPRRQPSAQRSVLLRSLWAVLLVACNAILGNTTTDIVDASNTDAGPLCVPRTECEPGTCGPLGDGCGGTLDCRCAAGTVCNGSQCTCVKAACDDNACGLLADGCSGTRDCGSCTTANFDCSEGGSCTCEPRTCEDKVCGWQPDGCGGEGFIACPDCDGGLTCGAQALDTCGAPDGSECVPRGCTDGKTKRCGLIAPGCGEHSLTFCGGCDAPETCGGSGHENICGCTPKTCEQLGVECGNDADDGCGGKVVCPACPGLTTCGGGGLPGQCGCTPGTCVSLGKTCGSQEDNCGGTLECGVCPAGSTCNNGACGQNCIATPQTESCKQKCGSVPDGCGGTYECAQCASPDTCNPTTHACTCVPLGAAQACGLGDCGVILDARCHLPVDCGTEKCSAAGLVCGASHRCGCENGSDPCGGLSGVGSSRCCANNERCFASGCCDTSTNNCGPDGPID